MEIKSLYLDNFRGFKEHIIYFKTETIIVGKNNAGKSSIIEALRLVAFVCRRFKTASYIPCPEWLIEEYNINYGLKCKGIEPNIKNLIHNYDTIFYFYNDKIPAKIIATFENNIKIEICLGKNERIFATLWNANDSIITSKLQASYLLTDMSILPQIGPLAENEKILTERYVKNSEEYSLSSLHFRNQIRNKFDLFDKYKEYMHKYSDNITITDLITGDNLTNLDKISLLIENNKFLVEISGLGNGFQMCAQIIWFLVKSESSNIIILDEPDVYLHADLQRKLYKLLLSLKKQFILTTHSIEIISSTDPGNILVANKNHKESKYLEDNKGLRNIIQQLGSTHNLQMTRLFNANRCIFVEGIDIEYLNAFYKKVYADEILDLYDVPNFQIGGRAELPSVKNIVKFLNENLQNNINYYCFLDKDYYTENEINKVENNHNIKNLFIHIWNKKEIENFLLVPIVIYRYLINNNINISENDIKNKIEELYNDDIATLIGCYTESIQKHEKNINNASQQAYLYVNNKSKFKDKIAICRGKHILKQLKAWLQDNYKICFKDIDLIPYFKLDDIDADLLQMLQKVHDNQVI